MCVTLPTERRVQDYKADVVSCAAGNKTDSGSSESERHETGHESRKDMRLTTL